MTHFLILPHEMPDAERALRAAGIEYATVPGFYRKPPTPGPMVNVCVRDDQSERAAVALREVRS